MAAKRLLDDSDQNSEQPNNKRMKPTFASYDHFLLELLYILCIVCSCLKALFLGILSNGLFDYLVCSVIQEVVAVKFLDSICSALEPMLRKVVCTPFISSRKLV